MSYITDHELFQLRQRVSRIEGQLAYIMEHLGLTFDQETDPGVTPEIIDLVRHGKKMQAIKLYRQQTGASLKDAKEFIDSLVV